MNVPRTSIGGSEGSSVERNAKLATTSGSASSRLAGSLTVTTSRFVPARMTEDWSRARTVGGGRRARRGRLARGGARRRSRSSRREGRCRRGGRRRLQLLRGQAVDAVGDHLRPGPEPDPVPQAPLRVHEERVGRVCHGVAGRGVGLDLRVGDAPGAGDGPDLVVGAGEADVPGLVVVHVLLHGRRVVPRRVDRDEDDADLPVDELEGIADVGQVRRADVGAVRVSEEDQHRLAAQLRQVERVPVLVGELQGRRGHGRADRRVAVEPLGCRRDRPDRGPGGRRGRGGRQEREPGHRPDRDPGERGEAEGKRGQQGETGRRHRSGRRSRDRPVALRGRAVGHRGRRFSSPAPRR